MNKFIPDRFSCYYILFCFGYSFIHFAIGDISEGVTWFLLPAFFYTLVTIFRFVTTPADRKREQLMTEVLGEIIKENDRNYNFYMRTVNELERMYEADGNKIDPDAMPVLYKLLMSFKGLRDYHFDNKMIATLKLTEHLHVKDEVK